MTYFLLWSIKEHILRNDGDQAVLVQIDFNCMDEKYTESQWESKLFGYQHFFCFP